MRYSLMDLAQQVKSSSKWASFLTPQENNLFEHALSLGDEVFNLFISGKLPCQVRVHQFDEPQVIDIDPLQLALKIRYMLFEFQLDKPQMQDSKPELSYLPASIHLRRIDKLKDKDDDYDDYDDSGADGGSVVPTALIVDAKPEDAEPDLRGKLGAIENKLKQYDTFEHDLEKMKRFARLKASDDDIREEVPKEPQSLQNFAKTAQFGSANLCLKHLLSKIETNRNSMQVTDVELRNLISDVRKNRSKWASEERIGQEELYEACERVVLELRGTTEHSTAFLNKVSKRDAPNYYDVIKNPMDLNTVMRKLRALQYNNKQDFLNDLNLIWDNCLTFNSDPRHFLRVHAIAMQKKTQSLAALIPDITIMSRQEVEAEAELLERVRGNKRRKLLDDESGKGLRRSKGVRVAKQGDDSAFRDTNKDDHKEVDPVGNDDSRENKDEDEVVDDGDVRPEGEGVADGEVKEDGHKEHEDHATVHDADPAGEPAQESAAHDSTAHDPSGHEPAEPTEPTEHAEHAEHAEPTEPTVPSVSAAPGPGAIDPELEYKALDVESQLWEEFTSKRRIQYIVDRKALFNENKLQMDAPTTCRNSHAMARFDKLIRNEQMSLGLLNEELPFLIEYEVSNGIPPPPISDQSLWTKMPIPKLDELPKSKYLSSNLLNQLVLKNLNNMRTIRKLCSKILYIKDLQMGQIPPNFKTLSMEKESGGAEIKDFDDDISSRLPGANQNDPQASHETMKKFVAKMVLHSGFETAQPRALDALADVAADYMHKLGRTLVSKLESPNSTGSFKSIILGSMQDMGIPNLNSLTKHISDDVLRQGRRLSRFRNRLNKMLVELLKPEVERYKDEQFSDNSEQFVLGQFSNELGDDYFGFKELGLDKELGVSNIAIPFHLLQQRAANSALGVKQSSEESEFSLTVPEYPVLSESLVNEMPEMLRPYFQKILDSYKSQYERLNEKPPFEEFVEGKVNAIRSSKPKVTINAKFVPRKRKFGNAFIIEPTPVEPAPESTPTDPTLVDPIPTNPTPVDPVPVDPVPAPAPAPAPNDMQVDPMHVSADPIDPGENKDEIDQSVPDDLGLDFEEEFTRDGFNLDDNAPTGSLLL